MPPVRADVALARRGLARSRTHAAQLIAAGHVHMDGASVAKASQPVREDAELRVSAPAAYVSRSAAKLVGALDAFEVSVSGRCALDLGASTGGFTQVLLERGAAHVVALDVGHDQLAAEIAEHDRVTVVEGFNVRDLTADALRGMGVAEDAWPTLAVADLSFISLTLVLPALRRAAPDADVVALVKPQFEVGRGNVRDGVVRDPALRVEAVAAVLRAAGECGYGVGGICPSQVVGAHGNREFLVQLCASGCAHPSEWIPRLETIVGA